MVVTMYVCVEHGRQPSKIIGRDGVPRCPACGLRLLPAADPDPRAKRPPRPDGRPL